MFRYFRLYSLNILMCSNEAYQIEIFEKLIPFCKCVYEVSVFYNTQFLNENPLPENTKHTQTDNVSAKKCNIDFLLQLYLKVYETARTYSH